MIRWKNGRMLIFSCFRFWLYTHLAKKKKRRILSVFLVCVVAFVLVELMSTGICTSAVCAVHWCVLHIHTLYFVLNSLKQLVLNILKATTTEWEHRLAYVLGRKHYSFYTLSRLFTCLGAQSCHHFSVSSLPELISISNQNKGWGLEWAQLILS